MLQGKNIALHGVRKESIETLRQWRNDPTLRKYFREYREITPEMQLKWFEEKVLMNRDQFDFEIRINDKLIGHCGLYYVNWVNRNAEFTIYIGDKTLRNKGYGSDALLTLCRYGFNTLNLHKIWCEVYSNNPAVHVYRKLGFVDEGIKRQTYYDDGKYWDSYLLGMLKNEWDAIYK